MIEYYDWGRNLTGVEQLIIILLGIAALVVSVILWEGGRDKTRTTLEQYILEFILPFSMLTIPGMLGEADDLTFSFFWQTSANVIMFYISLSIIVASMIGLYRYIKKISATKFGRIVKNKSA